MNNLKSLGIIFANVHDELIPELTEKRSMASVPIGARYRLIDFSLSNLVNAGITAVGILTRGNYQSLMDHLGSGRPWDLDRKKGGIFLLPPFGTTHSGIFKGHVDALAGILTFLTRSHEELVVMCDADVISNIDLSKMIDAHINSGADITVGYKNGPLPFNNKDIMIFKSDIDGRINSADFAESTSENVDYSLDIFVMRRTLLIDLITAADKRRLTSLSKEVFVPNLNTLKMYGYEIKEYAEVIDTPERYVEINNGLLNPENRKKLFNPDRPIYTKTRDDMPTRFGINSVAENSLIASGCVIDGTVKNSILFRGVRVLPGATVENCILMQGTTVGKDSNLQYVLCDKAAKISDGITMNGRADKYLFIGKGKEV